MVAFVEYNKILPQKTLIAWVSFVLLLVVYQLNGSFQISNDTTANVYLPVSLLNEGNLSFSREEFPFMFADDHHEHQYYLAKSIHEGVYLDAYGIGTGITALPVFAVLKLAFHDFSANHRLLWYGGKFVASLSVAGSAVFVFLSAAYFLRLRFALLIAIVYGLGTCVWSVSSQALWQHGPSELFLSMGMWALIRSRHGYINSAFLVGGGLGLAVLCRPTNTLLVIAVLAEVLISNRKDLIKFMLGGLPFAVPLLFYNIYYFGTPLFFGQMELGREFTGAVNELGLWRTPLWEGVKGVLFSPSRGLLIYSPVMLFALPSLFIVFKDSRYRIFIPAALGAIGIIAIAFKWFFWWGGFTFGYRLIVDAMPLLALLLIPMMEHVFKKPWITTVFFITLAWSIGVQILGAYAYSMLGWQNRIFFDLVYQDKSFVRIGAHPFDSVENIVSIAQKTGAVEIKRSSGNIDTPENQHRLWSMREGQLAYSLLNFDKVRLEKKQEMENWINNFNDQ